MFHSLSSEIGIALLNVNSNCVPDAIGVKDSLGAGGCFGIALLNVNSICVPGAISVKDSLGAGGCFGVQNSEEADVV